MRFLRSPVVPAMLIVLAGFVVSWGLRPDGGREFASDERLLQTESPVDRAVIRTFGFPGKNMRQRIWVTLVEGYDVGDVFDMSIFGPLRPGTTGIDARATLGTPIRSSIDRCGEEWSFYNTGNAEVVVGCRHDISGFPFFSLRCGWELHALPEDDVDVLHRQLHTYLVEARRIESTIATREIVIRSSHSVLQVFVNDSLAERDVDSVVWRDGNGQTQRAFCLGAH